MNSTVICSIVSGSVIHSIFVSESCERAHARNLVWHGTHPRDHIAIYNAGSPSTCPAALRCFDSSLSSELPCMLK